MSDYVTHTLPDVSLNDHLRGILDQLDESNVELKDCLSMPPAVYTSEEWFEFEKRAIWDREWICVGHIGTCLSFINPGILLTECLIRNQHNFTSVAPANLGQMGGV